MEANGIDPDQTSHYVASEMCVHCLHKHPKRGIWSKKSLSHIENSRIRGKQGYFI